MVTNSPGDRGSIPGPVIPKIQPTVLDASWLNSLHYKVWIKSERRNPGKKVTLTPLPVVAIEKGASGRPQLRSTDLFNSIWRTWISEINLSWKWNTISKFLLNKNIYFALVYFVFTNPSARAGYFVLPTPPLGQDMTQGKIFLKRSLTGLNSEFSFS